MERFRCTVPCLFQALALCIGWAHTLSKTISSRADGEFPALRRHENPGVRTRLSLQSIKSGNRRHLASGTVGAAAGDLSPECGQPVEETTRWLRRPLAVVLSAAETQARAPQRVFDAAPGDLVVQRVAGLIAGRIGGGLQKSLEHLVQWRNPEGHVTVPLLLVLADVTSQVNMLALKQARGLGKHKAPATQMVLDQLSVPAKRALDEVANLPDRDGAEEDEVICDTMARHSALYALERLLIDSDVLRTLVSRGELELHAAILRLSGELSILGLHPQQPRLLQMPPAAERARRLKCMASHM